MIRTGRRTVQEWALRSGDRGSVGLLVFELKLSYQDLVAMMSERGVGIVQGNAT
jgi:hypothetical protein